MRERLCHVKFTKAEINWIIQALNHDLCLYQAEYDAAEDGSVTQDLSELAIVSRSKLIQRLTDVAYSFEYHPMKNKEDNLNGEKFDD